MGNAPHTAPGFLTGSLTTSSSGGSAILITITLLLGISLLLGLALILG